MIKNLEAIMLSMCLLFLFWSCSKDDETDDLAKTEFEFTYKDSNGNLHTAYSDGRNRLDYISNILTITIDRVDLFGGKIYYDRTHCAYLEPEPIRIFRGEGCTLSAYVGGVKTGIDSMKVFMYQSGSFDVVVSDCQMVRLNPISSSTTQICTVSGTFDLTLVNSKNETIEITNGVIRNLTVFKW